MLGRSIVPSWHEPEVAAPSALVRFLITTGVDAYDRCHRAKWGQGAFPVLDLQLSQHSK